MGVSRNREIGARIQRVRRTKKITQTQLGEMVSGSRYHVPMNRQAIAKIEHGRRVVTFEEAVEFARALNVSLDFLAGLEAGFTKWGTE